MIPLPEVKKTRHGRVFYCPIGRSNLAHLSLMPVFILRRVLQSLLVLFGMSVLVFAGLFAIGNPVELLAGSQADAGAITRTTAALGLDQPLRVQYVRFMSAAMQGDLGHSYIHGESAMRLILQRLPATLELAMVALLLAVGLGLPLGLLAGLRPRTWVARLIQGGALLGFALPGFWVGLLLIMLFAVTLGWLPASGRGTTVEVLGISLSLLSRDGWSHILLPAVNLALFKLALIIRLTSSSTREAMQQDYVLLARAKGLRPARIVGVHVLRNILLPLITVIGLEFGSLIAFAVVTETVFAWPGMGKLLIDSIIQLDRPVVVAYLLLTVTLFISINLLVDVLYALLDPRVRLEGSPT